MTNTNTDSSIVETIFNTQEGYEDCEHCQSVLSPAAYFVKLMETVEKYITGNSLKDRRPDLYNVELSCESTNKTKLYLEIINKILETNLKKNNPNTDVLKEVAEAKYPFNLPANINLIKIRAYLKDCGINLADVFKVLIPDSDNFVAESLGLSTEEYDVITDISNSNLQVLYGVSPAELNKVDVFIKQTNVNRDELSNLLQCYNKLHGKNLELSNDKINNLDDAALGFLHRFIRLSNKLGLSFNELARILQLIDGKLINKEAIKKRLAKVKRLQEKLKKPLIEVCKVYYCAYKIENNEENARNIAESLLLSFSKAQLEGLYNIEKPLEPFKEQSVSEFMLQSGMDYAMIERILRSDDNNKKISKTYNLDTKELEFLDFFKKLSAKIELLLSQVNISDKLKKLECESDTNCITLEKLLAVDRDSLKSLINYNNEFNQESKAKLVDAYSQVMLARLMNISIYELLQILISLKINRLTSEEIERIVELKEFLDERGLTIDQLNRFINASPIFCESLKELSSIKKELKQITGEEDKLNVIQNATNTSSDLIEAVNEFTKNNQTELKILRLESEDKNRDLCIIGKKAVLFEERNRSIDYMKLDEYKQIPEERDNISVAKVGEKTIFFGGEKSSNEPTKRIDIYTKDTNEWKTISASGEARCSASVAVIGNKAIFFGGRRNAKDASNTVDMYNNDAGDGEWKTISASGEARYSASVAVIGNKAIFFGGRNAEGASNAIDIYNNDTGNWETSVASEARYGSAVAVVNNQAIFFGGNKGENDYSLSVNIYNTKTNKWKSLSLEQKTTKDTSVAVLGTKVVFFTPKENVINIYDSVTGAWVNGEAKKTENRDKYEINNNLNYSKRISLYDNKTKGWNDLDIYSNETIKIENNKVKVGNKEYTASCINKVKVEDKEVEDKEDTASCISYDATIEELLNNLAVFKTLNLDADDIKHITKHKELYDLKATWTQEQIIRLANYKMLKESFSGNKISLIEYIEWLRSENFVENQAADKIYDLTGWDKEAVKTTIVELFSQTLPIDSLQKAKSFFDLVIKSGIDANNLLKLKDLTWENCKKFEDELREKTNIKEKTINSLEDQKRSMLVSYFMHKKGIANMRELYAHLLIDVEMSDCSKISVLKAGLNSLQLYIHRCMMGLEKEVTVSKEFTEEMWDLLNNYREWEANKKIALYPENYLNPTLRRTATTQFKELHNTLMQGVITDEAASDAYLKYFEDFSSLLNLEKVDTHFANDKVYVVGRTLEEPYIYYYRVADYNEKDGKKEAQTWGPWQKIETQAPVKDLRLVYAFGKLFVFWLQKTDREKQIEDISINDSVLNAYFIFQKADGSWSAQQRIPYDIKRESEIENKVRNLFSNRKEFKRELVIYEGHRENGTKEYGYFIGNKDNPYEKGSWYSDNNKPVQEMIEYFENKIKAADEEIKKLADRSREENKNFFGKLEVILKNSKIEITSMELGFKNFTFELDKNFKLEQNDDSRTDEQRKEYIRLAKESAYGGTDATIKDIIEKQKNAYEAEHKKLEENIKSIENDITRLGSEKGTKETEKNNKETEFQEQKQDLSGKIKKLEEKLDGLSNKDTSSSEGTEEKIDVESLNARINNLKENITQAITDEGTQKTKLESQLKDENQKISQLKGGETTDRNNEKEPLNQLNNLEKQTKESTERKNPEYLKIDSKKLKELNELESQRKNLETQESYKTLITIVELNNKISSFDTEINNKKEELKVKKQEKDNNYSKTPEEKNDELDKEKDRKIKELEALNSLKDEGLDRVVGGIYNASYTNNIRIALQEKLGSITQEKFKGFNGIYLYEIFFHIPTLIAYLFNQEQNFAEARKWYQCIFDPTKKGCDAWKFPPFNSGCSTKEGYGQVECVDDTKKESNNLADVYKQAHEKKTSFEKYIITSYVDNIIDWGDKSFMQESWEGINEATMLYVRAWDLLGERPKKKIKRTVKPAIACQLLDNKNIVCINAETNAPISTSTSLSSTTEAKEALDTVSYCGYFCTPENKDFIALWDTIEDRLYKIRHCLDIKGKRLELPLFQPPIDPRQLLSAAAGGGAFRLSKVSIPHYRFSYMINYAKSIADTVSQIGSEFLGVLEKRDSEEMNILYNKQEGIIANLITAIKEKAIEALKKESEGLNESLNSAKYRKKHYEQLIEAGLSSLEQASIGLSTVSIGLLTASSVISGIAVAAHFTPTIFGFSIGGFKPGNSVEAASQALNSTSNALANISQNIGTYASYERRAEDWELQEVMAKHDVEQIKHQISANKINQLNAEQDLKAHKESIKQIKEKEHFFKTKFTSKELYSWMKGELARLYFQSYKLAVEVARQAEWSYQYELDSNKSFIQNGHWNSLKQGLLAGSKLKFELEQLNKEYHDNNERRLEISKVISLKQLEPIALYELKTKGECKFSLTEKLFDLDFPGHYCRKIKGIRITIPAVVGPYENVHATLQQTSNKIVLKPDIDAVKFLLGDTTEQLETVRESYKNNQQIAISRGDQDSGLFEFNFNDERYLPFEGTGVVSDWILKLPKSTNRFDINSISDVIIHIDYTALDGGEKLANDIKTLPKLENYNGWLMLNLKSAYSKEWQEFKNGNDNSLNIVLSRNIFPSNLTDPKIESNDKMYLLPSNMNVQITINGKEWNKNELAIVDYNLEVGETWVIEVPKEIENMMMIIPYKAKINW